MIYSLLQVLLKKEIKIVNKRAIFFGFNVVRSSVGLKLMVLSCFIICVSCDRFTVNKEEVIARVGTVYLYRTDLEKELDSFVNTEDSILKSRNYIDQWTRKEILLQQAEINLNTEIIENLDVLIEEYKIDLYSNTYKQTVFNRSIDTLISTTEIDSFLIENQSVFKLNAPLFQVRFIQLPPDNVDIN